LPSLAIFGFSGTLFRGVTYLKQDISVLET